MVIRTDEDAEKALSDLSEKLKALERSKIFNIFDAVGMATQEIKHSAFLAWLLNPMETHKTGGKFLTDFLSALYCYASDGDDDTFSNENIITSNFTYDELIDFATATDITVETEKIIDDPDSRIDIFMRSAQKNTVIVIENKVFSSTHDDQLNKYEREVKTLDAIDRHVKKLFVYLTPRGDMPKDINGKYQAGWCIIDYGTIINNLNARLKEIKNIKLKNLIEDYIAMVGNKILHNNQAIRALCKKIRREHSDAIDILLNYIDNVDMAYNYISEWVVKMFPDAEIEHSGRKLVFNTHEIRNYYARNGLDLSLGNGLNRFQISVNSKDGPVTIGMWLSKAADSEWTDADIKIRDILLPNKRMGEKYCTLYSRTILTEEEREKVFDKDDELYKLIDDRLKEFPAVLRNLEERLAL